MGGEVNILDKIKTHYKRGGLVDVLLTAISKTRAMIKTKLMTWYLSRSAPVFGLNQTEAREHKVIISLTSFPPRFSMLHICIKSLLRQSFKPDRILLYLGDDSEKHQIPEKVRQLVSFGLEIIHRSGNLKGHKKYFYAIQENPEDIIITVDDDIIYEQDLVNSLMASYRRYPTAVSAKRVHKLVTNKAGELAPYNDFFHIYHDEKEPSMQLIATGSAGALYPPHCLPKEAFDSEPIKRLCLNADDIWLKFVQIKNNTPVVWVKSSFIHSHLMELPVSKQCALSAANIGSLAENDMYILRLQDYFSIQLADYCRQ